MVVLYNIVADDRYGPLVITELIIVDVYHQREQVCLHTMSLGRIRFDVNMHYDCMTSISDTVCLSHSHSH